MLRLLFGSISSCFIDGVADLRSWRVSIGFSSSAFAESFSGKEDVHGSICLWSGLGYRRPDACLVRERRFLVGRYRTDGPARWNTPRQRLPDLRSVLIRNFRRRTMRMSANWRRRISRWLLPAVVPVATVVIAATGVWTCSRAPKQPYILVSTPAPKPLPYLDDWIEEHPLPVIRFLVVKNTSGHHPIGNARIVGLKIDIRTGDNGFSGTYSTQAGESYTVTGEGFTDTIVTIGDADIKSEEKLVQLSTSIETQERDPS